MLGNIGPSQGLKGLENGPVWRHKWPKNRSEPLFYENDPSPPMEPKPMNTAHFLIRFPVRTSFAVEVSWTMGLLVYGTWSRIIFGKNTFLTHF